MENNSLETESKNLLETARRAGLRLATAESCTGGLIAAALTAIAGSSDVVERGFVAYSNAAKSDLLGVPEALIRSHGAVSLPVARAMAEGALARSDAQAAVSVTGIAGPGGATESKPVGLVFVGAAVRGRETVVEEHRFEGDRTAVRHAAALAALALLAQRIG